MTYVKYDHYVQAGVGVQAGSDSFTSLRPKAVVTQTQVNQARGSCRHMCRISMTNEKEQ